MKPATLHDLTRVASAMSYGYWRDMTPRELCDEYGFDYDNADALSIYDPPTPDAEEQITIVRWMDNGQLHLEMFRYMPKRINPDRLLVQTSSYTFAGKVEA